MLQFSKAFFVAAFATLLLQTGCSTQNRMNSRRSEIIAKLEYEMATNTSWLRIHAAEGLLDNDERANIAELFRDEAKTAIAPYRIGVWRVLARSTSGDERQSCIEQIREAMRDPNAIDRVSAAESLGKLNAASRADREFISNWLKTADDATAPFPRWLLVLSSNASERESDETALAKLLSSPDPVARLRAAFALGRLKNLSAHSIARLEEQLKVEPTDSIARVYLITALLLHAKDAPLIADLEKQLVPYFSGKANEQLETGIVSGLRGKKEAIPLLESNLNSSETDGRIGAANGLLKLLK